MRNRLHMQFCLIVGLMIGLSGIVSAFEEQDAEHPVRDYEATDREQVFEQCAAWIEQVAPERLEAWREFRDAAPARSTTELIVKAIGLADAQHKAYIERLDSVSNYQLRKLGLEQQPELNDPWIRTNFRVWLASQFVQRNMLEEGYEVLADVDPELTVEPSKLFFHRAVCSHQLLMREEAGESLDVLLNHCASLPDRYRSLGQLMQQDLTRWKEKSLDEIARKMKDVERQLDIGRGGKQVQIAEQDISNALNELIEKLEKQAQQASGSGSGSGSRNNPDSPAQESRVKGSTAPGEVDEKDLGTESNWGALPPKDQARAKQILGTMFPPHYQRAIEAYNRKAAQRDRESP